MKRRSLIHSSVLEISALVSDLSLAKSLPKNKETPIDGHYDIVIIGSGAAGLTTAIEAADWGAKVLVLEKLSSPMGNTIYAGGNFNATNTWVQKRDGIKDNVDDFYEDMMAVSL